MKRLLTVLATLGPVACLPPAEDAGHVDPTEPGSTGGDASDTDGGATGTDATDGTTGMEDIPPSLDPSIEWSLELEPDATIFQMIRSPDGVVLVLQSDELVEPSAEVLELSSDMEILWSRPLPGASIADLDALGGGEYLLAGSTTMASGPVATAWRLSCCVGNEYTSLPVGVLEHPAAVSVIEPRAGGVFMGIEEFETFSTILLQTPLDLFPTPALGTLGFSVIDGSRTPSGNVVLHVTGDGFTDHQLYEIGADGTGSLTPLEELTVLVGKGDDLTLVRLDEQGLGIRPYDGGEVVPVSIPGYPFPGFLVDRRERFAFTFMAEDPEGGSSVQVFELGEDGTVLRELVLPHGLYPYAQPTALAVGEDDAIYVAIIEGDGGGLGARFLHRIAPL